MTFRVLIEWLKHDWQDDFNVVANEIAEVFVVPEVQCSLRNLLDLVSWDCKVQDAVAYLEMWACDRLCELIEQRLLNLGKLCGVHDLENIFHFIQEHDLFSTVDFRPVS